jgi:DNA-directed RNA polymerase subunit alpha
MAVRLGRFELPKVPTKDEASATPNYAKFTAEPFEAGYGVTIGNALRRVLLSSIEGGAITNVRITGASHEFQTLPHVVEDVTDIILNLKKVKFVCADHEPRTLSISVNKEGAITAGDIQEVTGIEVVNKDQHSRRWIRSTSLKPNSPSAWAVALRLVTRINSPTCRLA